MERPELRLVREVPPARGRAGAAWGAAVLAAALVGTLAGAGAARAPFDPGAIAEDAFARSVSAADPSIAQGALQALRARLVHVPLDAATRTVLASLMTEVASSGGEREAAADQAEVATKLVASDEWVSRAAARVLARAGRRDEAVAQIASMFEYAPSTAALALSEIEPFLAADEMARGIPDRREAWLAWAVRLREMGREQDADERLGALLAKWPDDVPARTVAAGVAAGRDDTAALARAVPPALSLPQTAEAASLFAFRARTKAAAGDVVGARADVATALDLRGDDPWVRVAAGDAEIAFDAAAARADWTRALYTLEASHAPDPSIVWIRFRLARLDDQEGHGANALRNWRSILAARPDSEEARRRVEELSGGGPR